LQEKIKGNYNEVYTVKSESILFVIFSRKFPRKKLFSIKKSGSNDLYSSGSMARSHAARSPTTDSEPESETRYRALFEHALEGIFRSIPEGRFVEVNPALVRMLGYTSADEVLALRLPDELYLDPPERTRLRQQYESTGVLNGVEAHWKKKDGSPLVVRLYARTLCNAQGTVVGYEGMVLDITQQKQAEAALQQQIQLARGQTLTLVNTLRALARAPALEEFAGQVLTAIARQVEACVATVWVYEDGQDRPSLILLYEAGRLRPAGTLDEWVASYPPLVRESALWQKLVQTRKPIVVEDVAHQLDLASRETLAAQGVKTLLLVPLLMAKDVIGWLGLRHTTLRSYLPEEVALAEALSHQITLAMQLTRLAEQAQRAAVLEERNRLAREIHDSLAQGLTGVILQIEAAQRVLTSNPRKASTRLEDARTLACESLAEARHSVLALRSKTLEQESLSMALAQLAKRAATASSLAITSQVRGTVRALPAEEEQQLYRIAQEAVYNACTHAQARAIRINLCFGKWRVQLQVQDDGRGLDAQELVNGNGLGLTSMRERAEQIGGRFSLTAQLGKGTKIKVVVPYSRLIPARRRP
jgi:PAS domain S-box-containing protein